MAISRSFTLALTVFMSASMVSLVAVRAQSEPVGPQKMEQKGRVSEKSLVIEQNRQAAIASPVKRGDRMVCKQEAILGTRLKGMVTCRTADEWRRISRGFQAELKRTNDKAALAYSTN